MLPGRHEEAVGTPAALVGLTIDLNHRGTEILEDGEPDMASSDLDRRCTVWHTHPQFLRFFGNPLTLSGHCGDPASKFPPYVGIPVAVDCPTRRWSHEHRCSTDPLFLKTVLYSFAPNQNLRGFLAVER